MLPIDKVLHFKPFNETGEMKENLNIFLSFFATQKSFDIITDISNGILAFFLATLIGTYFYTSHIKDDSNENHLLI